MKKRKTISTASPTLSPRSLVTESDKGCAIVVGTITEVGLLALHEAHISINTNSLETPKKLHESLTCPYAPLSTFAGKIQIAYGYGLISQQDYENLELIRKIRNEAAHSLYDFSLQDAGVRKMVLRLTAKSPIAGVTVNWSDPSIPEFLKLSDERQHFIKAGVGLQILLLGKVADALATVVDREKLRRKQRLQNDNSAAAAL